MSNVKKLLSDERRRSSSDSQRISETHVLFAQVLKEYNSVIDNIRQIQQEKRSTYIDVRFQQNSDADSKHDSPQTTHLVDSLMTKLNKSQDEAQEEKIRATQLAQKLEQYDLLLEEIPLLKAQVI